MQLKGTLGKFVLHLIKFYTEVLANTYLHIWLKSRFQL